MASADANRPRVGSNLATFVIGLPLGIGAVWLVLRGPLRETLVGRYLSHPVEWAEVVLFCCALVAFALKAWNLLAERAALRRGLLPEWDGKPAPVSDAGPMLAGFEKLPGRLRATFLGRRIAAVLAFIRNRRSAAELDDQLRSLADSDAIAQDGSYSLTRFITWAIPILGFLGTVLGITDAVAGVTPDRLENDLNSVTEGLALAFDTTALALGLTMILMLASSLLDRAEQAVLAAVDQLIDLHLAHRFERTGSAGSEFVEVVRQNTDVLLQATARLVEHQAAVWTRTIAEADRRRLEAEANIAARIEDAVSTALEKTLQAHGQRLADLEKKTALRFANLVDKLGEFAKVAEQLGKQTEALTRLQEGEKHILKLQETLRLNLEHLTGAGSFEQAVQSLTAAVHMLTLHAGRRPGAAA